MIFRSSFVFTTLVCTALSGCGGDGSGSSGTGGGSTATTSGGTGGAGTSSAGTGGASSASSTSTSVTSSGSSSSTGGMTGNNTIWCDANGAPQAFPYTSHSAAGPSTVVLTTPAGFPAMTMVIGDIFTAGAHACGTAATEIGYSEGTPQKNTTYGSKNAGGSCTINIDQVAKNPGEHLLGTFSATLPENGGPGTMELKNGHFDITY